MGFTDVQDSADRYSFWPACIFYFYVPDLLKKFSEVDAALHKLLARPSNGPSQVYRQNQELRSRKSNGGRGSGPRSSGQRAAQGGSGDERRFGLAANLKSSSRVSVLIIA